MTARTLLDGRWGWLAVAALAAALIVINPAGYAAGGGDDGHYLEAAICWSQHHWMCLPHDHWSSRWPALAPQAWLIDLFGLHRPAVSLGSLASWVAALVAIGWLGSLWWNRSAGLIAAALFASVPIATNLALRPNVDLGELAAQAASLAFATLAVRRGSRLAAIAAGLACAFAFEARDTSLLFGLLGAGAWLAFGGEQRRLLVWAAAGFAAVIGAEMAAYALAAGDPLLRFKLSLHHGTIHSTSLKAGVDTSRSPILNPAFIAGWKRPLGIEWWWPVDAWLNLLPSRMIGAWLLAGPVLAALAWRLAPKGDRSVTRRLGAAVLLMALGFVYGLALDPRPRMFLFAAAGSALVFGWAAATLLANRRPLVPAVMFLMLTLYGAATLAALTNIRPMERAAGEWIARYPNAIETDPLTRQTMLLARGGEALPLAPSGRPLRLVLASRACRRVFANSIAEGHAVLVGNVDLRTREALCLFRYGSASRG